MRRLFVLSLGLFTLVTAAAVAAEPPTAPNYRFEPIPFQELPLVISGAGRSCTNQATGEVYSTDTAHGVIAWNDVPEASGYVYYYDVDTTIGTVERRTRGHDPHPGASDSFSVNASCGQGTATAPAGTHWGGTYGASTNNGDAAQLAAAIIANVRNVAVYAEFPDYDITGGLYFEQRFPTADKTPKAGRPIEIQLLLFNNEDSTDLVRGINWAGLQLESGDNYEIVEGPIPGAIQPNFQLNPAQGIQRRWIIKPLNDEPITIRTSATGRNAAFLPVEVEFEQEIEVEPQALDVSIQLAAPDARRGGAKEVALNSMTMGSIVVQSFTDQPLDVRFDDSPLRSSNASRLEVTDVPSETSFVLQPEDIVTFPFTVSGKDAGEAELATSVSAQADGEIFSDDAKQPVLIGKALEVKIDVTPNPLFFGDPDKESKPRSARCRTLQTQREDVSNCIEVKATITNNSKRTISDVVVQGLEAQPHRGLTLASLSETLGVPVTFIEHDAASITPKTLTAGASTDVIWRVEAFDGPARVRVRTLVTGNDGGETATALGEGQMRVTKDTLAEIRIRPTRFAALPVGPGDPLETDAGNAISIGGTIKNVSEDRELEITLQEVFSGNAGHGILYSPDSWLYGRSPAARQPFVIQPQQTMNLKALVRTVRAVVGVTSTMSYSVKAFALTRQRGRHRHQRRGLGSGRVHR